MEEPIIGYLPDGPIVWRIVYNSTFKQFDDIKKALNYMKEKLEKKHCHRVSIQRVNLKEVEINER